MVLPLCRGYRAVCVVATWLGEGDRSATNTLQLIAHSLLAWRPMTRAAVLSVVFSLQNFLAYYSSARLDAHLVTVLQQSKLLTTAFFGVVVLRRRLGVTKWLALVCMGTWSVYQ